MPQCGDLGVVVDVALANQVFIIDRQSHLVATRSGLEITNRTPDFSLLIRSRLLERSSGIQRNASVPRGIRKKDQPNLSSTIWLTVSDQKNLVYYYQDTNSPGALWVKLDKIDFKEGCGVRKLTLVGKPDTTGDQSANFEKSEPFKFLAPR